MKNTASAHPSKSFFVGMLTRDIALVDSVLDLIDNCIDGIQRQIKDKPNRSASKPYANFFAKLEIGPDAFQILDNCGGIPRATAEKYAFRMGRPAGMKDERLPTVGVYGIGMKRAIFKMGRSCRVVTVNAGAAYEVAISSGWMDDDADWDLPIRDLKGSLIPKVLRSSAGTLVSITDLLPNISHEFNRQESQFLDVLSSTIATHYSYILHKGFEIWVNEKRIRPKDLGLLVTPRSIPKEQRIEPFVYKSEKDGVSIDLIVGLYRAMPSQKEIDDELEGNSTASSKGNCGWTIICNDRVVVYSDKSRLTGWGEATVPSYHPQFIAIAGVVRFQSNNAKLLPVTTTKRGIEASSELYLAVKDVMREGLKHFTNFTNHWKTNKTERIALMNKAVAIDPFSVAANISTPQSNWTAVRKGLGGKKFVPKLPEPPREPETSKTIRFKKPIKDFALVSEFLFDIPNADSEKVGIACFDRTLERAKK